MPHCRLISVSGCGAESSFLGWSADWKFFHVLYQPRPSHFDDRNEIGVCLGWGQTACSALADFAAVQDFPRNADHSSCRR